MTIALIHAGNTICNNTCRVTEYLSIFPSLLKRRRDARERRSLDQSSKEEKEEENDDIFTAFDFSFQKVINKNTLASQDAVELLNIISFYHFDSIPVDIFERAMQLEREKIQNYSETSLRARLSRAIQRRLTQPEALPRILKQRANDMHPLAIREALRELSAIFFISYAEDGRSFSLHPLVHAWAKDRIPPRERSLWAMIAFNTLMASFEIMPQNSGGESDSIFQRTLLHHLNSCLVDCPPDFKEFECLQIGKIRRYELLVPIYKSTIRDSIQKAAKCGLLYAQTGDFAKSAYYLSITKDALIMLVGLNNAVTMTAMLRLADILWGLGRLDEAITLQEQVVEARQRVLGPLHRETLQAMDSLGKSFWLNGQYCEALDLQEQTAEKMRAQLGDEDEDTLNALDNLGVTLGAWYRFEESQSIHRKVLSSRLATLKSNDLKLFETKSNLAMALLDLQQLDEAKSIMEEVYNGRKMQMGKEHPYTLLALCFLSKIYIEYGELGKAENILLEGIAAGKRSLGEDHLGVLVGCGELAKTYARQGRLDEAEALTLVTVNKIKISRGEEHPDYSFGMWKLGKLWEMKREFQTAVGAYRIALNATENRLTAKHPLFAMISDRIAHLTSEHGPSDVVK